MADMTLNQAIDILNGYALLNDPRAEAISRVLEELAERLKPLHPNVTNIPELIHAHGSMAAACRATGLSERTIQKYRDDVNCEHHVIYKGRLMSHKRHSPRIYSRTGVTRTDRLKKEM